MAFSTWLLMFGAIGEDLFLTGNAGNAMPEQNVHCRMC